MVNAPCPNCQSDVPIRDPKVGKNVLCPGCGIGLKIVWLLPVELDILTEAENMWNNFAPDILDENTYN